MKILLDANVVIAATATQGLCHLIVELCISDHELIVSERLLQEVAEKLRMKLKVPPAKIRSLLSLLKETGHSVKPLAVDSRACKDPQDLHILGAALAGKAELIITGDQDLLSLKSFQNIPIISPRSFWDLHRK